MNTQDAGRSGSVLGKLEDVTNVLFRPQNYRDKRRRQAESNIYSAEQSKDQIEKLIQIEERERIRSIKKRMEEAQEYNRFLIRKHGAEGAAQLAEKGLVDFSEIVDFADAEKVFEMHGDEMLFESGNTKMHPEISLMDLHDVSGEEERGSADLLEATGGELP